MKIKDLIYKIIISIIILFAVLYLVKGIMFSGSITFSIVILVIYIIVITSTSSICRFFLLPKSYSVEVLVSVALVILFWTVINNWIGGVSIVNLNKNILEIIIKVLPSAKIGDFGTIAIVSICLSTVYQTLNFLNK